MDDLDIRIISMLQDDGRASNAGIAREVGISEATVRRRLKRLFQDEFIRVSALRNPGKMGYRRMNHQAWPRNDLSTLAGSRRVSCVMPSTDWYSLGASIAINVPHQALVPPIRTLGSISV